MLAIDVKRGVEATLERVFQNTGRKFDQLTVRWSGNTAGIIVDKKYGRTVANIVFPAIDETKDISRDRFNQLIGYALHELGHAWFTDNEHWDQARNDHGAFVSGLINGLEDPRIEQCVIDSGYAPNSHALFENLINQILTKSGHADGDDLANIPFLLAVEGRRLNGYNICLPNPIDSSPYAEHLNWALTEARKAVNTQRVVEVAIELHERLKQAFDQPDQPEDKPEDQPGDEPGDQPGDEQGDLDNGNPGGDSGDDGDGGDDGDKPSDRPGDKPSNKPGDKPSDKLADESNKGKGKGRFPANPDRDVEPNGFIEDELADSKCDADEYLDRPDVGKPIIREIIFEE